MGKTAWAINIAQNSAVKDGKVVVVFSLEMSDFLRFVFEDLMAK